MNSKDFSSHSETIVIHLFILFLNNNFLGLGNKRERSPDYDHDHDEKGEWKGA